VSATNLIVSKSRHAPFKFVIDDQEAVAILAAYYPAADNIPEETRRQSAIARWQKLHPVQSGLAAEREVEKILRQEAREQALLVAYAQVIFQHNSILMDAAKFLDEA
jgi:hypothetical protein